MGEAADGSAGADDGADELVVRGAYLSGPRYRLHDGDVVRVRPGTAHLARWGDLVAARAADGALAVGVLAPPPPRAEGAEAGGAWLVSDWDGPLVRLCCCAYPHLLGLAAPVDLRRALNRYDPPPVGIARGHRRRKVRRLPLAYRREARIPVRPARSEPAEPRR